MNSGVDEPLKSARVRMCMQNLHKKARVHLERLFFIPSNGCFFRPVSSVQFVSQTFHRIGIFAALQISILHSLPWNLAKIEQGNEWTIFARLIFFTSKILYCVLCNVK